MTRRAWPQVSVEYGSLRRAKPSAGYPKQDDRLAYCPECHHARRIDVNDVFYSHFGGRKRTVDYMTEWLECRMSGRNFVPLAQPMPDRVVRPFSRPEAPAKIVPSSLAPSVLAATLRINKRTISECEQVIRRREIYIESYGIGVDYQRREIQKLRAEINGMLDENDLLNALLAA